MDNISQNVWDSFESYIRAEFGLALTPQQLELFKIYLNELRIWNEKFNLVSYKTEEEIVFRHFADSLSALKLIPKYLTKDFSLADIGTGAGFPGIPLKIAIPEIKLTLIESITKKCTFLENLVKKLSLKDTEILNDRAEIIGQNKKYREGFDLAVSRALFKFSPNLEVALPLVKLGGHLIVYKTEKSAFGEEGLNSVEKAFSILGGEFIDHFCYKLPKSELTYCLLVFEKTKSTPPEYPRKIGTPDKKPL